MSVSYQQNSCGGTTTNTTRLFRKHAAFVRFCQQIDYKHVHANLFHIHAKQSKRSFHSRVFPFRWAPQFKLSVAKSRYLRLHHSETFTWHVFGDIACPITRSNCIRSVSLCVASAVCSPFVFVVLEDKCVKVCSLWPLLNVNTGRSDWACCTPKESAAYLIFCQKTAHTHTHM